MAEYNLYRALQNLIDRKIQSDMIRSLLLVGTGGFIGSICRFLASKFVQGNLTSSFPLGTLLVNITGCLIIGLIYGASDRSPGLTPGWKLFLATGLCGGFTTFSAFANENLALLRDGEFFNFFLYTGLSLFFGIGATFIGVLITKIF
jgi:fluoride exporter